MEKTRITWLNSASSTNSEALRLVETGEASQGTVVATLNQVAGRGQGDSFWESEAGKNLALSIILHPKTIPPSQQFILNQAVSIGVLEGIRKIAKGESFTIKWPNDIYYKASKVAGILIENSILGDKYSLAVVGIGVNLNQERFVSGAPNPISLRNICNREFDIDQSLQIVVDSVWNWYQALLEGNSELVKSEYLKNLLGLEVSRFFRAKGKMFCGAITGLDEYGRLVVKIEGGTSKIFDFKEIEFLH